MKTIYRDLYLYPGRAENHDYVAFPISNTLICGQTGSGKTSITNNLIIRAIQEFNPREIGITVVDSPVRRFSIWSNAVGGMRIVPQIGNYFSFDKTEDFIMFTKDIQENIKNRHLDFLYSGEVELQDYLQSESSQWVRSIFVIDEFQYYWDNASDEDKKFLTEAWEEIIKVSEDYGLYFFMISQSYEKALSDNCLSYFDIKICAKHNKEVSLGMLCDGELAQKLKNRGDIYCKYLWNEAVHLFIPFYPDTWIRKFIKYYSIYKTEATT